MTASVFIGIYQSSGIHICLTWHITNKLEMKNYIDVAPWFSLHFVNPENNITRIAIVKIISLTLTRKLHLELVTYLIGWKNSYSNCACMRKFTRKPRFDLSLTSFLTASVPIHHIASSRHCAFFLDIPTMIATRNFCLQKFLRWR